MAGEYFNVNATRPDWSGPAGLAGMMAAQQEKQYNQSVALQQLMQAAHADDYLKDAPTREAARQKSISGDTLETMFNKAAQADPNYMPSRLGGLEGTWNTQAAQGDIAQGTKGSAIDLKNSQNKLGALAAQGERLGVLSSISPMMAQSEWQQIYPTLPDDIKGQFPPNGYWDQSIPERIKNLSKSIANNPEARAAMALTKEKTGSAENIAIGHDATQLEIARINAEARTKAAWEKYGPNAQKKIETIIANSLDKLSKGEPFTPAEEKAFQIAQMIIMDIRAASNPWAPQSTLGFGLLGQPQPLPPRQSPVTSSGEREKADPLGIRK